jgi:Tol biopolymer transport system component
VRFVVLAIACAGCGRIDFGELSRAADAAGDDAAHDAGRDGPSVCSAWGNVLPLGAVNTTGQDWEPALAPDGNLLVYSHTDAAGNINKLHTATRNGNQFTPLTQLTLEVVELGSDAGPAWTPDGSELFFVSDRLVADADRLYVTAVTSGVFGTTTMVSELASVEVDGPAIAPNGLELIYGDDSGQPEMHRATRASTTSPWVVDRALDELNSGHGDGWPTLSPDGLTMVFESGRLDVMHHSLFVTTRPMLDALWTMPQVISELPSDAGDPDLVSDTELMFAAIVSNGVGENDLYVATRACN